jgi:hypothetical protein
MVEPFHDANKGGTVHTKMWAQRFSDLREQALKQPKFGMDTANDEVCDSPPRLFYRSLCLMIIVMLS